MHICIYRFPLTQLVTCKQIDGWMDWTDVFYRKVSVYLCPSRLGQKNGTLLTCVIQTDWQQVVLEAITI